MRGGLEDAAFNRPLVIAHFGNDFAVIHNRNFVFRNEFLRAIHLGIIVDVKRFSNGDEFIRAGGTLAIGEVCVRVFALIARDLHICRGEIHIDIHGIQRDELEIRIGLRDVYGVIARRRIVAHFERQLAQRAVFGFEGRVGIDEVVVSICGIGNERTIAEQVARLAAVGGDAGQLKSGIIVFQLPRCAREAGIVRDGGRYGERIAGLQRVRCGAYERHFRRARRQGGHGGENARQQHRQSEQNAEKLVGFASHVDLLLQCYSIVSVGIAPAPVLAEPVPATDFRIAIASLTSTL